MKISNNPKSLKLLGAAGLFMSLGGMAMADGTGYDYTVPGAILTAGIAAAVLAATGMSGLNAGVTVYRKIRSYFAKAG